MSKVNPDHYKLPCGIEAYEVTQHFDFTTGNAIKYLWRAGLKEGEYKLTDLKKCLWYVTKLIEKEEENEVLSEPIAPISAARSCDHFVSDYYVAEDLRAWRDAT